MEKSTKKKSKRGRKAKREPRLTVGQSLLLHGLGYLVVFLFVFAWLLPAGHEHSHGVVNGVVIAVDAPHRTFTVRLDATGGPSTYAWSGATEFTSHGVKIAPDALVPGTRVAILSRGGGSPASAVRVQVLARLENLNAPYENPPTSSTSR